MALPESLQLAASGLSLVYDRSFDNLRKEQGDIMKLAEIVESKAASTVFAAMKPLAPMTAWTKNITPDTAAWDAIVVETQDFATQLSLSYNDLADDKLGLYAGRFEKLGALAAEFLPNLVNYTLENGTSIDSIDGYALFASDRVWPGTEVAAQSNLQDGYALTQANYEAMRVKMAGFKDHLGNKLGMRANTLIVPGELEGTARSILFADMLSDGTTAYTNTSKGTANLIVLPRASSATTWYLADLRPTQLQPIVLVETQAPTLDTVDVAIDREIVFRVLGRAGLAGGFWPAIMKMTA